MSKYRENHLASHFCKLKHFSYHTNAFSHTGGPRNYQIENRFPSHMLYALFLPFTTPVKGMAKLFATLTAYHNSRTVHPKMYK